MNQKTIRFLKNLSTGLVVAAMVFAFLIAGIRIFGFQVYGVLTGSMEPQYPTGSLIYVKDVNPSELRVNDVITFSVSPNVIATHRIVEIVPDENNPSILRYRTKGDANNDVDAALVGANNIIGKAMFAIPKLGDIASYIQQPPGVYVAILLCGLMIAFVFYTDSLENKTKEQQDAAEKKGFDLAAIVNPLSQKLLGKDLIKREPERETANTLGYAPQQTMQQYPQQYQQQYPQQGQYAQGYAQYQTGPQYPQQYAAQGYQQVQQYPQQYSQQRQMQQYPQQQYPQQGQYTQGYAQYQTGPQYPQQYTAQGYQQVQQYPQQPRQQQYPQQPQQQYYPQQPGQGMMQNGYQPQQMQQPGYAPQQPDGTMQRQRNRRTEWNQ